MPDYLSGVSNASMYGAPTSRGTTDPSGMGGTPPAPTSPSQGPGGDPSAGPGGDPTQGPNASSNSALQGMIGLRMGTQPTAAPVKPVTAINPTTGLTNGDTGGLLNNAKSWLGTPYVYGGTSRSGVDCSGFTQAVYKQTFGIDIGRDTTAQWQKGQLVGQQGNLQSSLAQAQPGDLIFYGAQGASGPNAHVAIYAGNGKMYDAPHTGASVELTNVWQGDGSEPFMGIRRYASPNTPTSQYSTVGNTGGPINTPQDFAAALLRGLGDPTTQANINSITQWENREGGNWHNTASFNPLNTTYSDAGAPSMNSVGVKQYANWAEGLKETIDTFTKNPGFYGDILAALKAGNGLAGGRYSGLGKWSGGGYYSL